MFIHSLGALDSLDRALTILHDNAKGYWRVSFYNPRTAEREDYSACYALPGLEVDLRARWGKKHRKWVERQILFQHDADRFAFQQIGMNLIDVREIIEDQSAARQKAEAQWKALTSAIPTTQPCHGASSPHTCFYCSTDLLHNQSDKGVPGVTKHTIRTRDHVVAKSIGGKNVQENRVWACQHCNSSKGNDIPDITTLQRIGAEFKETADAFEFYVGSVLIGSVWKGQHVRAA